MRRLNTLKYLSPHVTGVIRFAGESHGTDDFKQLDHFDVLGRSYEDPTTEVAPRLKEHPIAQTLRGDQANAKLRAIPVRLVFDKPENALSGRYEAFDREFNRLACCGDGENAARADFATGGVNQVQCPGPDACSFANERGLTCQLSVRLKLQIDGQQDPLSVFEFQSGGIHSYRTLGAKLSTLSALLGGLRGVPLMLTSYERGSSAHDYKTFYVADLVLRDGQTLESLAASDAHDATSKLAYAAMEAAFEEAASDAPFAVSDEYDSGVVLFTRPASPPPRPERRAAPSVARTIASIVELASRAQAPSEATSAPEEGAPAVALSEDAPLALQLQEPREEAAGSELAPTML